MIERIDVHVDLACMGKSVKQFHTMDPLLSFVLVKQFTVPRARSG